MGMSMLRKKAGKMPLAKKGKRMGERMPMDGWTRGFMPRW